MDTHLRQQRLQRARDLVLPKYTVAHESTQRGAHVFVLTGGQKVWRVTVNISGMPPPSCTCPDFVQRSRGEPFACKHVLAVLVSQPQLRHLALDFLM